MPFTIHYGYLYGPVNIFMTRPPPTERYTFGQGHILGESESIL